MDCRQPEVAIFKIRSYKAVFFQLLEFQHNLCPLLNFFHRKFTYLLCISMQRLFWPWKVSKYSCVCVCWHILRDRLTSAGPKVVPAVQQFIISLGIILLALEPLLGAKLVELPCIVIVRFLRECIHNNAPIHRANHLQSITIDSCYTIPLPPVLPRTKSRMFLKRQRSFLWPGD